MRLQYKFLIIFALLALTSLSCEAVNRMAEGTPISPTFEYNSNAGELTFKPDQLPDAQTGEAYSVRLTVEDTHTPVGNFSTQEGQLPPGLELKQLEDVENTAEISGTPSQAGTYHFVVYVWCYGTNSPGQTGEKEYTIIVK
jgi:hypothetical protein